MKGMKRFLGIYSFLLAIAMLFSACKGTPEPPEILPELAQLPPLPPPSLVFDTIEAETPYNLTLFFTLGIENPLPFAGQAKLDSWQVEINGQVALSGFSLEGEKSSFQIAAGNSALFPLRLNMDVAALIAEGLAPADNYEVNLITTLEFSGTDGAISGPAASDAVFPPRVQVSALVAFPGVQAPVFSITDIAILKAELINTRFRVGMTIDNPNSFPVELSAFGYELFGNGRFWAEGIERDIIQVPAKSSVSGNIFLMMNFMGMRRQLLDQIINLVDVNYRFIGEAQVSTGVEFLPKFTTRFDLSGFSQVLER